MTSEKEKILTIDKENTNENYFSFKIFRYFFYLFQEQKEFKIFFKYIQIFIETIQFISYAFSQNHYNSWKLEQKNIIIISNILGGLRLSVIMQFIDYKIYCIILYIINILIFFFCLIVLLQIISFDSTSIGNKFFLKLIRSFIDIISIIFYIPITEIILMPIRCIDGRVFGIKNGEICWTKIHFLNATLGIFGAFLLFIWSIFMLNFSFFPFQKIESTIRINSNNDIVIIILKLILILQYLLISNEYISLFILIISSITMFVICYSDSIYNSRNIEIALNMRNLVIIWSYFVLFISKLFNNLSANGFIYLLVIGYPIFIYLSIIISKEKDYKEIYFSENSYNLNDYIRKLNYNIKIINSYIERNNNKRNMNKSEEQKDIIFLKGNIKLHNIKCTDNDCPLNKFIKNERNFTIQRQCLLNYMNIFFNNGLKKFPNNIYILLSYIEFNYIHRFNLNTVKINLIKLKKAECNLKEKFVLYCMEQKIKDMNYNGSYYNEKAEENDTQLDINGQKYQKLKQLIENSIKLYAEFWGIFTTNITIVIKTNKLYTIGAKLNAYLNEINYLWDNELKNKRTNIEYQNIVQLYSNFLSEILLDRKKSLDISYKLKHENLNDYHLNDNKKEKEEKNKNITIIESLLDNQDYLLFCNSDEKGNYKIIQCSISFSELLGYQKFDLIGKSLENIFPNILIKQYLKYIEESLKLISNGQNNNEEDLIAYDDKNPNNNTKLIVVKNNIGYIFPLFASFKFINGNDYSDSLFIRIKMEKKELKSE